MFKQPPPAPTASAVGPCPTVIQIVGRPPPPRHWKFTQHHLLLDYNWKVYDDLCGSDHFPILLNNIGPEVDEPVSRWKLNKASWAQFQTVCKARLLEDTVQKADDPIEFFASILINIADKTVPKTATKSKKAKNLGLQIIVKPLLNNIKEHYDNSIIVQLTII